MPLPAINSASVGKSHSSSSTWKWVQRFFSVLAFGVVLYLFWPLVAELRSVVDLFKQAVWAWFGFAIIIQFVSYIFLTMLNYLLLSSFPGRIGFWRLLAILPTMAFIEVALPSAGLSGVVLRARLLGKNGYSVETSSFTLFMETVYLAVVMFVISLAGVWFLLKSGGIHPAQWLGLSIIILALVGASIAIYRVARDKQRGMKWAGWISARWNHVMRLMGRATISTEDLETRVSDFYNGTSRLKNISPLFLLGASAGRVSLDILSLWACFAAFRYVIAPGILLAGYGLVLIFSGLAALPGGLGLVDASLAVIFAQLGAPGAVAVASALSYRLIAFWFLRFAGFVLWQVLEAKP